MPRSAMRPNVTKRPGNKRYIAGRRAEYEARDLLISEGWNHVQRAAGSKGAADLLAVSDKGMCMDCGLDVLFVSVKRGTGRADKAQRERLAALPGRKELWTRQRGGVWIREVIQ
jgi:Holliday junction resolvase-like predicted endonuclease